MNPQIGLARARFERLTLRERALITASVIAVLWVCWDWTAHRALSARIAAQRGTIASVAERIAAESTEAERLRDAAAQDPNRRLAEQAEALSRQIAAVDSRLESLVGGFVEPASMPALLQDVVAHHHRIRLTRVANLPVEPVLQQNGQPVPGLFRHGMRVELRSTYFDVRDYLRELERAPWRLAWRSMRYQVDAFPEAVVLLDVETMSREKDWLGV